MNNIKIKEYMKTLNMHTKEVLEKLLSDIILEIKFRNRVSKDILEQIVLVYLSLFGEKNYLEYDELKLSEKNIICRIISKGIASIYVDNEYITKDNIEDKLIIINDLIDLLSFILRNY